VILGLALMCAAMAARGIAWHAILRAALPHSRVKRSDAMQGTFIGVLMSATLPARLGEPSRSLIVARRIGRPVETLPVVLGTIVSQTLLNLLALAILGTVMFSSVDIFNGHHSALIAVAIAPAALVAAIVIVPLLIRRPGARSGADRRAALLARVHATALRVRAGMRVFREPRLAGVAVGAQLGAWALQVRLMLRPAAGAWAHWPRRSRSCGRRALCRERHRGSPGGTVETSVSSRPPVSPSSPAASMYRPPTRSPTASSCRPLRSPPRS